MPATRKPFGVQKTSMIEAVRSSIRGSGVVNAPDVAAHRRALDPAPSETPTREGLLWVQPQPMPAPVSATPTANNIASISAPTTRALAAMAADVYNDIAAPPPGYRVAGDTDLARLGLTSQDLTSRNSAFRARVYVTNANENAEFVVAFRGTTNSSDWQANLRQGVGLTSDHYFRAFQIARQLSGHPDARVTLTGHSLGGGLASAAALATGRNASTFNAAGLSPATINQASAIRDRAQIGRAADVQAFYVRGEVLSAIQDGGDRTIGAIFGGAVGARLADAPAAYGTRRVLDPVRPSGVPWYADTPVARHAMTWVSSSLGNR